MRHTCHAEGCKKVVPPSMFMCRGHWFSLSKQMRDAVWREYRPGQENDKNPSNRYMAVQRRALAEVIFKPNDEAASLAAAPFVIESQLWRQRAIDAGEGDPMPWCDDVHLQETD